MEHQRNVLPRVDYVVDGLGGAGSYKEPMTIQPEDIGRLSAEAVQQQYELAAKSVAAMGEVIKGHIARLEATLRECDADMKAVAECSAEIAAKGQLIAAEIEHTNAIAAEIRSMAVEFKKKVGATAAVALVVCAVWWAPPVYAFDGQPKFAEQHTAQYYQSPGLLEIREVLAKALQAYGKQREQHDRDTFPTDMPKAGEPYDPVTGNAIRR